MLIASSGVSSGGNFRSREVLGFRTSAEALGRVVSSRDSLAGTGEDLRFDELAACPTAALLLLFFGGEGCAGAESSSALTPLSSSDATGFRLPLVEPVPLVDLLPFFCFFASISCSYSPASCGLTYQTMEAGTHIRKGLRGSAGAFVDSPFLLPGAGPSPSSSSSLDIALLLPVSFLVPLIPAFVNSTNIFGSTFTRYSSVLSVDTCCRVMVIFMMKD